MRLSFWSKFTLIFHVLVLMCCTVFANPDLFRHARALQREGKFDEAICAFRDFLFHPLDNGEPSGEQLGIYTDALMQFMNTFQSKGDPEACINALQEVFDVSPMIQKYCLRDYYSVLGYALSRTERMKEAEETMLKVFALPLNNPTPERYFRDYAYAAAVFYSNSEYQKEVIYWCKEALLQAGLCKNTSGKQWVMAMLGTIYKRNGCFNEALELFQQSKEESLSKNDDLGVLNSLYALIDMFLYWNIPEYANIYASEAIEVEENMAVENPMVSAQAYINKGRALYRLGEIDSVYNYIARAMEFCQSLPYNSGMVDVDLLHGMCMIGMGGDSMHVGVEKLQRVAVDGTAVNRARAYHQLAQTYLRIGKSGEAEVMLDNMYSLLNKNGSPIYIYIDYKPIIRHYLKRKNYDKVELYVGLMLQEQQAFNEKMLNFNLVETVVDQQTKQKRQELRIMQLAQENHHLWLYVCISMSVIAISMVVALLFRQKRQHRKQMRQADEKLTSLVEKLNQTNAEKEMRAEEIKEFLKDRDNCQELETMIPTILHTDGESKFRQYFDLLYPLFIPRLREKVPSITYREELLSMLIVLKQSNKRISELLAIAPRSVLMLRHRFRQKIGMTTEKSLENFIEEILNSNNVPTAAPEAEQESLDKTTQM